MPQTHDTHTEPPPLDITAEQTHDRSQNGGSHNETPSDRLMLKLRSYILLLATVVATVTYAAGFSPPGGVWQDTTAGHLAGDPIILDTHRCWRYLVFFYCNATAFSASVVVIVLVLILGSLDDKEGSSLRIASNHGSKPWVAIRILQAVMVLGLLSLMGAYAAGTCRDTFTKVYSSVLVLIVFVYVVAQIALAYYAVEQEVQEKKAGERLRKRKVLMLLATFAVSITYVAGLSTPGGFWDSAGPSHRPGDAILMDRHSARLAVFFGFNTTAFAASLLIVVVLLDTKLREVYAYGFIFVALVSLIGAYTAGSCRQADTTVYVVSLVLAVIGFILLVALAIGAIWKKEDGSRDEADHQPEARDKPTEIDAMDHGREAEDGDEAARKARSLVLLLATLAATITYQAGLDPPGGFWQDNRDGHMAGDPILLTASHGQRYETFFYCNSVSFVASLVAVVLVHSKHLLMHHVLEAVMILDLLGLVGAYAAGTCRDWSSSICAMALAGAVLVYVVIHVVLARPDHTEDSSEKRHEVVEKKRKRLLVLAILVATITYQAGLTPPGGFLLQDDGRLGIGNRAGDPVLLHNFPRRYKAFFYCNSVSFMLSIALILLLVDPSLYRPAIQSHALSVCTAVGLLGLMGAYAAGSTQYMKTSICTMILFAAVLLLVALLFRLFLFMGWGNPESLVETEKGDEATKKIKRRDAKHRFLKLLAVLLLAFTRGGGNKQDTIIIHAKRKHLMLLGILVASVTYQAGIKPPGGTWQRSSGGFEAGYPVMHDNWRPLYLAFFYSNSTAFMASIVVIILLLLLQEKLFHKRSRLWLVVMNTAIVLDLLGLLVAYAAGSSRRWKTAGYVFLLVIAVLAYVAIHLLLSNVRKTRQSTQENNQAQPESQV
ncbi:hypothetical protein BS78_08G067100 [Paspalum vaginatum]|nr:hypothetical protein BS78_08G067100 [Paspalum vaginatum]